MRHAILGAGAIGGLIATALGSLGEEVTLIVRPEKVDAYPQELSLERPNGPLMAEAKAVPRLTSAVDVLWLATKTYQLDGALKTIDANPPVIVPLLNGVDHVAVLRQRFGNDRVIPATIAVEAEQTAPGRFVQRSTVRLHLAASGEPVLGAIVRGLRELGFACEFIANEHTLLWSKLCFLAPFALATSASEKNLGEILGDAEWRMKLDSAIDEACAVANAEGAQIDAAKMIAVFNGLPATMRSSMAKDLVAGRRLELDGIAGPILRGGKAHRIPVPTTEQLVGAVQELASVKRT